uniref:DH domain-containing protein n=1 Tax=Meloidogyne incognita TaxID=6306 RepID=A0A914LCT5_MELIC
MLLKRKGREGDGGEIDEEDGEVEKKSEEEEEEKDEIDSGCPESDEQQQHPSDPTSISRSCSASNSSAVIRRHSSSTTDSGRADSLIIRPLKRERLLGQSFFASQRSLWCELPEVKESGILEQLNEDQRKLQEAYFEVITSEASYLRSISFLISHFMSAPELMGSKNTQSVIMSSERKQLFSNILAIRDGSEHLLVELEARLKQGLVLPDICDKLFIFICFFIFLLFFFIFYFFLQWLHQGQHQHSMRHLEALRMIYKILFIVNVSKSYAHKTLFRCRYSNVPTTVLWE